VCDDVYIYISPATDALFPFFFAPKTVFWAKRLVMPEKNVSQIVKYGIS